MEYLYGNYKYGYYKYGNSHKFLFVQGCVMRSLNSSLICILGWFKSDLGVVLLYFGFDLQISYENGEIVHFWKIWCFMPRRRSTCLSEGLRLDEG